MFTKKKMSGPEPGAADAIAAKFKANDAKAKMPPMPMKKMPQKKGGKK